MAATYMPTEDHGLSTAAIALSSDRRANEVLVAEIALGLAGSTLTGDDAERARTAVARQVNLQVKLADGGDIIAEGKGRQSVTYASVNGARVMVDRLAFSIAQALVGPPVRGTAGEAEIRW